MGSPAFHQGDPYEEKTFGIATGTGIRPCPDRLHRGFKRRRLQVSGRRRHSGAARGSGGI